MPTIIFLSCWIKQKILKKIQKAISQQRRLWDDSVIGSIRNLSPHLNNNHTGRICLMYSCRSITNFMFNSLQLLGLQHARFPCPSLSPRVCSNSCPLSWWCHPTISSPISPPFLLPSIFRSIRVFLHVIINPSNVYSGLISIRIDWFDLLAIQRTLKSLLQHHNSRASIWCSALFMVQLSQSHMTTGKTIALTIWTFVGKWCLCFLIHCLDLS